LNGLIAQLFTFGATLVERFAPLAEMLQQRASGGGGRAAGDQEPGVDWASFGLDVVEQLMKRRRAR